MSHYRIVEWAKHQHYKDRDPPWIKLHRDLLTSQTWVMLSDASRVLAIACMLVAAGTENRIPTNPDFMKRRAYLNKVDFDPLVEVGFIELVNDDNAVADASKAEQPQASATECSSEAEKSKDREEEEERAFAAYVASADKQSWPKPQKLDPARRKKLRARLDEHGLDGWQTMLAKACASDFLCSKFALKFDWIVEPKNFTKVIEGNYDGKAQTAAPAKGETPPPVDRESDAQWIARMKGYKPGARWWNEHDLGPRPETGRSRVPEHILAQWENAQAQH